MAALLGTGWEGQDWDIYLGTGWTETGISSPTIVTTTPHQDNGEGGDYCLLLASFQGIRSPNVGDSARWCRFAFRCEISGAPSPTNGLWLYFEREGSATPQALLIISTDGFLTLIDGDGTTRGTSVDPITLGTWTWITVELNATDTGYCKVYVDNDPAPVIIYTGDFEWAAEGPFWNQPRFDNTASGCNIWLDDLHFSAFDQEQPTGQVYYVALVPVSDVTTELTPLSGTDNFAAIDEVPPDMTNYVEGTVLEQTDVYEMSDLDCIPTAIEECYVYVLGGNGDETIEGVAVGLRSNGVDGNYAIVQAELDVAYGMNFVAIDPDTVTFWTADGINAMQMVAIVAEFGK